MKVLADEITRLCFDKYNTLRKTGKPSNSEWTVLSGVVLKKTNGSLSVVSLSTGTKCLSGLELLDTESWEKGSRLSDSHAEVLARRGFLRYLYNELDLVHSNLNSDIFSFDSDGKVKVQQGVSFHFFSSQTPCGDCSIFVEQMENVNDENGPCPKIRKVSIHGINDKSLVANEKSRTVFNDMHRTGAKCSVTEERQDLYQPGVYYHVLGPLRTKPGRGDRTLSLSCSDKMAKWNAVGIQGSLLALLIPPIRLESITIGGGCPFSLEAMERGLFKRFGSEIQGLNIVQATFAFVHRKNSTRMRPCPSSIVWCAVQNRQVEIAVEGRKQGATRKKRGSSLLVSRRELLRSFFKIVDKCCYVDNQPRHPKKITYYHCKKWSSSYRDSWKELRLKNFCNWPSKPSLLQNFTL